MLLNWFFFITKHRIKYNAIRVCANSIDECRATETRSSKQSFKELSLIEHSLTKKNAVKAVDENVKPWTKVLFCCFL